ncbi:MAG: DciA family protein [Planctomycetaceae bacterium]
MSSPRRPTPPAASGPQAIGRIVSRLMARTGYDREQGSAALASAWEAAAPAALKGASRAGAVRRGVLEVFVRHSAHVQELGFQKRDVVARLQALAPDAGITDIRCRLAGD